MRVLGTEGDMSNYTIQLPAKEAKQVSTQIEEKIQGAKLSENIVIQCWGFELVIHTISSGGSFIGYVNDTSD